MPKKEITVFEGGPLQYQTFNKSSEHNIKSKNNHAGDCVLFQVTETKGKLVRKCLHMAQGTRTQVGQVSTLAMSIKLPLDV